VNSIPLQMIRVAFCYGGAGVPAGSPARIYVPESHPGRRSGVINLAFVRNRSHGSSKQPQVLTDALPSTHPHCLTKQGIECHLFFAGNRVAKFHEISSQEWICNERAKLFVIFTIAYTTGSSCSRNSVARTRQIRSQRHNDLTLQGWHIRSEGMLPV
jgi:hypothetical protein